MNLDKLTALADLERFGTFDYAVPMGWLMEDTEARRPHFWWYPAAKDGRRQSMFGRPLKWLAVGRLALRMLRKKEAANLADLHTYMELWKFVHPGKPLDAFGENLIREWIETEGSKWIHILEFSFKHMEIPAPAFLSAQFEQAA
jgi:hypothetical protein